MPHVHRPVRTAREAVLERDHGQCQLCFLPTIGSFQDLTDVAPSVDHIRKACDHGVYHPSNLRLAHKFCNSVREGYPEPWRHPRWDRRVAFPVLDVILRSA
jgi:5-methylcytosine-specific restriction endonuclease McrA